MPKTSPEKESIFRYTQSLLIAECKCSSKNNKKFPLSSKNLENSAVIPPLFPALTDPIPTAGGRSRTRDTATLETLYLI
jgi:hypothetical protein